MATLTTIRQTTSRYFGRYQSGTFASSGTTTTNVDSTLVSSLSIADTFTDYYLIIPAASTASDRTSRIVTAYTPSSGTLTWDRALSGATASNALAYELHGLMEPTTGWLNAINDALKRIMIVTEITVTPTAQATRHDLTTANTWLTNPAWVRQVGYLTSSETRANANPFYAQRSRDGWADTDGATVYINHPRLTVDSSNTDTWYIKVLKPAYNHCKATAGSFGGQSGLALETDEAPVDVDFIAWAAICMAFEQNRIDWGVDTDQQLQSKWQDAIRITTRMAAEWEVAHRSDTTLKFNQMSTSFGPFYPGYGWR